GHADHGQPAAEFVRTVDHGTFSLVLLPLPGVRESNATRPVSVPEDLPLTLKNCYAMLLNLTATARGLPRSQKRGASLPAARKAARKALAMSMAMVIGPTPPGTGVIAPATLSTEEKSTSPTSRVLPSPLSGATTRLMPTSTTVAPGLTQSPLTISGRPTAATRISALRHRAGKSCVREWAMVTVAFACSNRFAIGLPTILDRPTTTAFNPER